MNRRSGRLRLALVAASLPVLWAAAGSASGDVGPSTCDVPGIDDRCERWVAVYDHPDGHELFQGAERPLGMALDPLGDLVFVTGFSGDDESGSGATTVAFVAATGAIRWTAHHPGGTAYAVTTSPDGSRVFVTGSAASRSGSDVMTLAYARTGDLLWAARHRIAGSPGTDIGFAVAVGPDGDRVYVTGATDFYSDGGSDFLTLALDASTGRELWASLRDDRGGDAAFSLALSPDGARVLVTGYRNGRELFVPEYDADYTTVAYDAATGAEVWASHHDGGVESSYDAAWSVKVSPDGARAYVTGVSRVEGTGTSTQNYAATTIAYDAATGRRLWVDRYLGPTRGFNAASAMAVHPTGGRLFVAGISSGSGSDGDWDYVTIAYRPRSGARLWTRRYDVLDYEVARSVAVSPDGARVYTTGFSARPNPAGGDEIADYATVAYEAATGRRIWAARYNSSPEGTDLGYSSWPGFVLGQEIAVSPDSRRVVRMASFVYADDDDPSSDGVNHHDFGLLSYGR